MVQSILRNRKLQLFGGIVAALLIIRACNSFAPDDPPDVVIQDYIGAYMQEWNQPPTHGRFHGLTEPVLRTDSNGEFYMETTAHFQVGDGRGLIVQHKVFQIYENGSVYVINDAGERQRLQ